MQPHGMRIERCLNEPEDPVMTPANDNAPRLMSFNEVCTETTLSRFAINSLRNSGMFPAAVQLGERRIGFVRAEVNTWIDQRIAARAA